MKAVERKRIQVTETPRLAAIIERNTLPGEPKSATIARLVEYADALAQDDRGFMRFPGTRSLTSDDVADLLDDDIDVRDE